MELGLTTATGKASKKSVEVSDVVFGADFNESLVHQAVTAYLAGARAGTRAHKNRAEVSGGGRKPWRQKGTGRARSGTIRSPIWTGGGKTFASRPQDWSQKLNRKMYRAAMRSILSELVRQERLVVIDDLKMDAPKTKELVEKLNGLGLDSVMIVTHDLNEALFLSARNLHKVGLCEVGYVDPVALVGHDKVLITAESVEKLQEVLA
ncbi:MAG: 50S ribosomal protein L4 [Thiohalophilus sp.]|uniref:50S ribosomal protein L4 n=1 Tax=Thiohalophilus sp. TaxID=3028392 RepID=UPI00286FF9D4|nr:50S ribosomal protein L4 [Thiohalophilus sp.]MDR9436130.1 50S ribosomal protein L4 [Thiohalophilus sp.]